jgi:hypothetical protein
VARLNGGRPSLAKRGHKERRTSTGEARRTRCVHGEGKRRSRGKESAEWSSPVSSAGTPPSDSRGEDAYHGKLRQVRVVRERGGARSKTESLAVS